MNILIVCSGNTCRSPMAGGLLRKIAEARGLAVDVRTAGLAHHHRKRVAQNAVTVMAEMDIDIANEYSKPVTREILKWADLIIGVQRSHGDHIVEKFPKIGPKIRYLDSDVRDPFCGPLSEYREKRDALRDLLSRFVDSLKAASP